MTYILEEPSSTVSTVSVCFKYLIAFNCNRDFYASVCRYAYKIDKNDVCGLTLIYLLYIHMQRTS